MCVSTMLPGDRVGDLMVRVKSSQDVPGRLETSQDEEDFRRARPSMSGELSITRGVLGATEVLLNRRLKGIGGLADSLREPIEQCVLNVCDLKNLWLDSI